MLLMNPEMTISEISAQETIGPIITMTIADSPAAESTNRIIVADIVAMIAAVDGTGQRLLQLRHAQSQSYQLLQQETRRQKRS